MPVDGLTDHQVVQRDRPSGATIPLSGTSPEPVLIAVLDNAGTVVTEREAVGSGGPWSSTCRSAAPTTLSRKSLTAPGKGWSRTSSSATCGCSQASPTCRASAG